MNSFNEKVCVRKCSACGKEMVNGFVIDDGTTYYCSKKCLNKFIDDNEYDEMYNEGLAYYTEFDDEVE